jgi:hypothetical protein
LYAEAEFWASRKYVLTELVRDIKRGKLYFTGIKKTIPKTLLDKRLALYRIMK